MSTSWEKSSKWYGSIVGEKGHYYHRQVIIPKLLEMIGSGHLLDLACGQGVLADALPKNSKYCGVDISPSLINQAKKRGHRFLVGDCTMPLPLKNNEKFTHCTVILAAQNIEEPQKLFENAAKYLEKGGKLIIVLNHPCYRIPRQSSWEIDEKKKLQYRRVDTYMSSLKIPIQTHPGKGQKSENTISFHAPLSKWTEWLTNAGFAITGLHEWCSDKKSTGGAAKQENRARKEFPLFLCLEAKLPL